jgi:hypothetical protein
VACSTAAHKTAGLASMVRLATSFATRTPWFKSASSDSLYQLRAVGERFGPSRGFSVVGIASPQVPRRPEHLSGSPQANAIRCERSVWRSRLDETLGSRGSRSLCVWSVFECAPSCGVDSPDQPNTEIRRTHTPIKTNRAAYFLGKSQSRFPRRSAAQAGQSGIGSVEKGSSTERPDDHTRTAPQRGSSSSTE